MAVAAEKDSSPVYVHSVALAVPRGTFASPPPRVMQVFKSPPRRTRERLHTQTSHTLKSRDE